MAKYVDADSRAEEKCLAHRHLVRVHPRKEEAPSKRQPQIQAKTKK
jgi:hypothetical protein